jgi:uncharacterized protein (TIGR00725 family)
MSALRRPVIAVCGAGREQPALEASAEAVGRLLAEAGAVLVCGGLGGVMAAAARGAAQAGGLTVGVLPGRLATDANPWIALPLPTAMGEGRNVLVVRFADAVIAIGGEWGTLSEIALARKIGRDVVLLDPSPAASHLGLHTARDPEAAVRDALAAARRSRTQAWSPPPTSP